MVMSDPILHRYDRFRYARKLVIGRMSITPHTDSVWSPCMTKPNCSRTQECAPSQPIIYLHLIVSPPELWPSVNHSALSGFLGAVSI